MHIILKEFFLQFFFENIFFYKKENNNKKKIQKNILVMFLSFHLLLIKQFTLEYRKLKLFRNEKLILNFKNSIFGILKKNF